MLWAQSLDLEKQVYLNTSTSSSMTFGSFVTFPSLDPFIHKMEEMRVPARIFEDWGDKSS